MLTQNAITVIEKRYLKKDSSGNLAETPVDMFRRVANAVAEAEKNYGASDDDIKKLENKFYDLMNNLEFLPNSPTLMNAGHKHGQLSACFVIPVPDSTDGIFDAVKMMAITQKSGGGTGFSFSNLRPKGDRVKTTNGVASGPVSFMKIFDSATEEIRQGGRRRGANMGILNIHHPDILEFITTKDNENILTNFNLSVAVTDKFMKILENDGDYELINPRTNDVVKELKARDVWNLITTMAWKNGEPGIIFIDRINEFNPTPSLGRIEATNPCGEVGLLPHESCNLGSINLTKFVTDTLSGKKEGFKKGEWGIDFEKLKQTVKLAVRFLDNIIDINQYPFPQIADATKKTRKIGLGVMGFADMLLMLSIPYNSDDAIQASEKVMSFINRTALEYSVLLGKEKGSFPCFVETPFMAYLPALRNATLTTIAPTGSISIIAGCSSGIEPNFALLYTRRIMDNTILEEINPVFEKIAKEKGFYNEELIKKISTKGSLGHIGGISDDIKKVFVIAHDISYDWHVKMQSAFQKYTNNSVSKTINFPETATGEDVKNAFMLAYKTGCKGITVYRDKTREHQTLSKGTASKIKKELKQPRIRPEITKGITKKVKTGCGNLYITINEDKKGLCEVFIAIGKSGGCAAAATEAIGRMVSLALRSGIDINSIIKQLKGIRCPSPAWNNGEVVLSCEDAIAQALERYNTGTIQVQKQNFTSGQNICPDCGQFLNVQEGCVTCHSCGFSKCN